MILRWDITISFHHGSSRNVHRNSMSGAVDYEICVVCTRRTRHEFFCDSARINHIFKNVSATGSGWLVSSAEVRQATPVTTSDQISL
ncbi:unnamed protein product [Caretta caretta]